MGKGMAAAPPSTRTAATRALVGVGARQPPAGHVASTGTAHHAVQQARAFLVNPVHMVTTFKENEERKKQATI